VQLKQISRHEQWFELPNDPDSGRILIRETLEAEARETVIASSLRAQFGTNSAEVEYLREHTVRHIAGWENVQDESGNPAQCTYENKILLLQDPDILNFVVASIDTVQAEGAKRREDAEKN
jgi:hypothetical protein